MLFRHSIFFPLMLAKITRNDHYSQSLQIKNIGGKFLIDLLIKPDVGETEARNSFPPFLPVMFLVTHS